MQIEKNISLAPFTTFHIGGPARFFVRIRSVEELKESLDFARDQNVATLILGGGSNMLISDDGFDGLVIKIEIAGTEIEKMQSKQGQEEKIILIAGAGDSWDGIVARAVEEGLWGIENLSGIPGTVGGAVVQNIGAYGAAVSETVEWIEVFDAETNTVEKMSSTECSFDYRDSIFKHKDNLVSTRAAFALSTHSKPNLSYTDPSRLYKDIATRFADTIPTLAEIRGGILEIRRSKFPDLSVEGTAGSFFKNPIVTRQEAEVLRANYPEIPIFEMPETSGMKVPLGWLLDYRHGVIDMRRVVVGGARMYEKQFLVVAAARGTTAMDVKKLVEKVQMEVKEKVGINIQPEVKIIS